MLEQVKEIRKEVHGLEEELKEKDYTMNLLEKSLDHSNRRHVVTIRYLIGIIAALLVINGYFGYQLATTTVTETSEQSGVYNFMDAEGNMISSDLSLEKMKELVELNGEDQENETAG